MEYFRDCYLLDAINFFKQKQWLFILTKKSHNSGNLNHVPMGNLGASMCLDEEELQKFVKI